MTLKSIALLLFGSLLTGSTLMAQTTVTPRRETQVEGRAKRQQKRIAKGVATGQLTPMETRHLEKREGKLNLDIAKAEADGKITKGEQVRLNREENRNSNKILRKKHNARSTAF